jgi:hypothetical protein
LLSKSSVCSISAFSVTKARTLISSTASSPSKVREISSRVAPRVSMKKKIIVTSYLNQYGIQSLRGRDFSPEPRAIPRIGNRISIQHGRCRLGSHTGQRTMLNL